MWNRSGDAPINIYCKTGQFLEISINYSFTKISRNLFNTLIIDAEGSEKYYFDNIGEFKNIKYVYFELHYHLIPQHSIVNIFQQLKENNFELIDQCFNSFYFEKNFLSEEFNNSKC